MSTARRLVYRVNTRGRGRVPEPEQNVRMQVEERRDARYIEEPQMLSRPEPKVQMQVEERRDARHIEEPQKLSRCICNLPSCKVMCTVCNLQVKGRVKKPCPEHKNTIYLMDFTECFNCRADISKLIEIRENAN